MCFFFFFLLYERSSIPDWARGKTLAKIGSAVEKISSSSEKKLPFQDDDTPNTRGARVKKEMEVGSRLVAVVTDTFFSCFFLLREPISPPEYRR